MKFCGGKNVVTFLVFFCLYSFIISDAFVNKINSNILRKKSIVALLLTSNASVFNPEPGNKKNSCRWLRGLKHQHRLCQKKRGLPEILQETRKLAIKSCKLQFQYEQWNCAIKKKFFKKVYRETALMYSITTSAFMYLVSKACAEGTLANCKCASHGKSDNSSQWQWGGCGDNTKYAKTFTKKFLQLRKKGDGPNNILRYNNEIGIKVTLANEDKHCKCHGLSGSCSVKICWKRLSSFNKIAYDLKIQYHRAIQVESDNKIRKFKDDKQNTELLFLEQSPNFCPNTVGRRCQDTDNCATLCCGRGFSTSVRRFSERCNCRWRNDSTYQLQCQQCEKEELNYHCT